MIPRGRILIVDPYRKDLFTMAEFLGQAGYQCTPVWEREQAIQALHESRYDLVIAVIHVPANETFKLLHVAHQLTPGLPVIVYTRDPSLQKTIYDVQLFFNYGLMKPHGSIKPVAPDRLVEEVQKSTAISKSSSPIDAHKSITVDRQEDGDRIDQLTQALEETVRVLEATRRSFKSKELALLRKKLEAVLASRWPE